MAEAVTALADLPASELQRRIRAREVSDPAAYETFADPAAKQEEATGAADSVSRMIGELTPKQKEALELVKLKEMSMAEASAASGQSVAALKVNVHRAMKRLQRRNIGDEPE